MQITRGTDYAVRVLVHLVTLPKGTRVPASELARSGGAPTSFISKVLQQLVRAGMLTSSRGMGGGFALGVDPAKVTLLDVVEKMEGPLQMNLCLPGDDTCDRKSWCGVHPVWQEAQAAVKLILKSASIERLAKDTASNRDLEGKRRETVPLASGTPDHRIESGQLRQQLWK